MTTVGILQTRQVIIEKGYASIIPAIALYITYLKTHICQVDCPMMMPLVVDLDNEPIIINESEALMGLKNRSFSDGALLIAATGPGRNQGQV